MYFVFFLHLSSLIFVALDLSKSYSLCISMLFSIFLSFLIFPLFCFLSSCSKIYLSCSVLCVLSCSSLLCSFSIFPSSGTPLVFPPSLHISPSFMLSRSFVICSFSVFVWRWRVLFISGYRVYLSSVFTICKDFLLVLCQLPKKRTECWKTLAEVQVSYPFQVISAEMRPRIETLFIIST